MNYIKKNRITNLLCRYKLTIYFQEFDSKELERNARVIKYGEYQPNPKQELDYLLKDLFKIAAGLKPFSLYNPTYKQDGSKNRGRNNIKKAIIYDTCNDVPIFELDYWRIQLAKDVLFNGIPIVPPEKIFEKLDGQQRQDVRGFYACFGWVRQEVKIGNTYKKVWLNEHLNFNKKKAEKPIKVN